MTDAMEMPRSPLFESGALIREGDSNAVQEVDKLDYAEIQRIQEKSMSIADISKSKEFLKLEECLMKYKALLAERSPIAKLWFNILSTLKLGSYSFEQKEQESGHYILWQSQGCLICSQQLVY